MMWMTKAFNQILEGPSIEIHYKSFHTGGPLGPKIKFHKGPIGFLEGRGSHPTDPAELWSTITLWLIWAGYQQIKSFLEIAGVSPMPWPLFTKNTPFRQIGISMVFVRWLDGHLRSIVGIPTPIKWCFLLNRGPTGVKANIITTVLGDANLQCQTQDTWAGIRDHLSYKSVVCNHSFMSASGAKVQIFLDMKSIDSTKWYLELIFLCSGYVWINSLRPSDWYIHW